MLKTENINTIQTPEYLFSRVEKSKQTNKLLYIAQINRKNTEAIKAQEKWSVEFSENVLNWKHIYKLTFQFTIDTILRIFQYKYLMRILGTNKLLLQCNIVNSSLCDFCSMYVRYQALILGMSACTTLMVTVENFFK